jgi:hypothetical protein
MYINLVVIDNNIYNLSLSPSKNKNENSVFSIYITDDNMFENILIPLFTNKFKKINDYSFEGDFELMCDIIVKIITNDDTTEELNYNYENILDIDENIIKEFPCYNDDEIFGGYKQLVKVKINYDIITINYMEIIDNYIKLKEVRVYRNDNYFIKLLNQRVLINGNIYDLNNPKFIQTLINAKFNLNLEYFNSIDDLDENKYNLDISLKSRLIQKYFTTNIIINNNYHVFQEKKRNCLTLKYNYNYENYTYKNSTQFKYINKIYYEELYLLKYTPYYLIINKNNTEYYICNHCDQIITTENSSLINGFNKKIYLRNNNIPPFNLNTNESIKNAYKQLLTNLKINTTNLKCLNENEITNNIFEKII